ncbi:MAG TPA: hypothetical protein VFE27_13120, partial [Acidobacteriaceae bacterium]|nr:hypothetical protein [Acidobacteriaceae bacterium]
ANRPPGLRIVSSLRDSYINLSLPGTPVPGYRLYRPCGTAGDEEAAEKWDSEENPYPQGLKL